MPSHAPNDYLCPFCSIVQGNDLEGGGTSQAEIVYRDEQVTCFVASKWWWRNKGHLLVIPNQHVENLYTLPDDHGFALQRATRRAALTLKQVHGCDGVTIRQHNEPAGDQSVWHYHVHVYPRYRRDFFRLTWGSQAPVDERRALAMRLRMAFAAIEKDDITNKR